MNPSQAINRIREQAKAFGTGAAIHDVQIRALNRVVPFQILKGMTAVVADVDPKMFEAPGFETRFATREELLTSTANPEVAEEMSAAFVDEALERGDTCYGIFDGGVLASFGWYSNQPTPISSDLLLHFDPAWVYMYKGYTLPAYRGKRLHGIGMSLAMRAFTEQGSRGLISYVKSNNFQSLRSIARMGYRIFGDVYALRAFGRAFTWASPGCKAYDFHLEALPETADARPVSQTAAA